MLKINTLYELATVIFLIEIFIFWVNPNFFLNNYWWGCKMAFIFMLNFYTNSYYFFFLMVLQTVFIVKTNYKNFKINVYYKISSVYWTIHLINILCLSANSVCFLNIRNISLAIFVIVSFFYNFQWKLIIINYYYIAIIKINNELEDQKQDTFLTEIYEQLLSVILLELILTWIYYCIFGSFFFYGFSILFIFIFFILLQMHFYYIRNFDRNFFKRTITETKWLKLTKLK